MLVVLVLIGVLSTTLSIAFIQARNHAKRGRAETQLRELVRAWSTYYLTYTNWPASLAGRSDVPMDREALMPLFATLDDGSPNPNNTNAIPFLSLKQFRPDEVYYCDPWGNPYKISFTTRSDQQDTAMRAVVAFPNRDRYR